MTTVGKWTGHECRLLRIAFRLSVRDFAADLGVSPRTVSKWEALGSARTPHPEMQRALDTMLRAGSAEERDRFRLAALGDPSSAERALGGEPVPEVHAGDLSASRNAVDGLPRADVRWEAMSPVDRRDFLKQSLAAGTLSAFGLTDPEHITAALEDAHRYLDGPVVEAFARQLAVLKADDGQLGTGATLPLALGLVGAVSERAADVQPVVRQQLLRVGADAAEFAAFLYRDARDSVRSRYCYDRAIEWAQEAGDLALQGYILLKKAQLAWDLREPLPMLTLSQAATTGPWQLPTRVRAEAIQQVARAEAMLGASVGAVQDQLQRAGQLLQEADAAPDEQGLGSHYQLPLLRMQTGVCYAEAGEPGRALDVYDEVLAEDAFSPRDFGFFLSWRASAQALSGQPDAAAMTGLMSATRAVDSGSQRTNRELKRVLAVLGPWNHRPAVRDFAAALA